MISYILPTRNRPERLARTLRRLAGLDPATHDRIGGAEIIVLDNASDTPVRAVSQLSNGWDVKVERLDSNRAAAARNVGAAMASGQWLVMLDDDSFPTDCGLVDSLLDAPADVAAIGAEIRLPDGSHEAGGLPEVVVGCGAALRRDAYLAVHGYDETYEFYGEEYDLCAKLIRSGWRIMHDARFQVRHEKVSQNRDMNGILRRLVRNNGWTIVRYAPTERRTQLLEENVRRYAGIAVKEHATRGFSAGIAELLVTIAGQPERTMTEGEFDRFTGLAATRESLGCNQRLRQFDCKISIVEPGKNLWAIEQTLRELQCTIAAIDQSPDVVIVGTLSPGPMMDASERSRANGIEVVLPAMVFRTAEPVLVC